MNIFQKIFTKLHSILSRVHLVKKKDSIYCEVKHVALSTPGYGVDSLEAYLEAFVTLSEDETNPSAIALREKARLLLDDIKKYKEVR